MARPEKVQAVEELQALFENANSYFVTDYQGLNVADMTVLRRNFRENGVKFLVSKNTLLRRAVQAVGMESLEPFLTGPTAVAFVEKDPAVAAKIIYDSFKEKKLPRVKAFVVDDQLFEADDIKRLADLPPREVLLSQLVAAVESPLTSL
ncbi:MAG: 50S ribosomal protein L10, partial [Candidatus Zixiibacteriota bacterium]